MRARLGFAVLAAALVTAGVAAAEPLGSYLTFTPFAGYTTFDASLRFPGTSPLNDDLYVGARLGWFWRGRIGLEAAGGYTPTRENAPGGLDVNFGHGSGNLVLTPFKSRVGDAFITAGYGYGRLQRVTPAGGLSYGTAELGGGVRFWMTDGVGLRLEARNISFMQKTPIKFLDNNLAIGGGIELALGSRSRDTDGDGVTDKKDACPNTPHGAKVEARGCPLDTDGDGVYDGLDQCPGTPKGCTIDAKGCPSDADGDGVCDGLDKCPSTPHGATVDKDGCPIDSDGDGVFDGLDKCPGTPKGCSVDSLGCSRYPHAFCVWF